MDVFAYTVQDTLGAQRVADGYMLWPAVNPSPVGEGDDSAATALNTAVVINVLANDTDANGLNPASVSVELGRAAGSSIPYRVLSPISAFPDWTVSRIVAYISWGGFQCGRGQGCGCGGRQPASLGPE